MLAGEDEVVVLAERVDAVTTEPAIVALTHLFLELQRARLRVREACVRMT